MRNSLKRIGKKGIAFTLAMAMTLSMIGVVKYSPVTVEASTSEELPTIGARSETNSYGDVFLGGNYIEVGISKHGSFGTEKLPTGSGWHPHASADGIGLTSDGDGWDVGEEPQTGDFFLPGIPEECWGFAYTYNGTTYQYFVRDREWYYPSGSWSVEPSVKDESSVETGELKAVVTGVTTHNVEIKLTYSFGVDDKFYNTTVEINNKSGEEISNVRFIRSFDPDQDQQVHGGYATYNKVICNPVSTMEAGGENFAMVVARGYESLAGFFFLAFDNRARVARGVDFQPMEMYLSGYWEGAPVTEYTYALDSELELTEEMIDSSDSPNGYTLEDNAIAITFNFGVMKDGAGDACIFASSLDPDVEASLEAVKKAAGISVDPEYGRLEGFEADSDYEIVTYDPEDTEKENPIKKWNVVVAEDGSYTVKDASGNIVDEGIDAVNTGVYFLDEWYGYNLLVIKKGVDGEEDAESEIEAVNPEETIVPEAPDNTLPVVTGNVSALEITNLKENQQYRIYDYNDKLIYDWFTPSADDVAYGYIVEPIDCGCANTSEHTHPYYVVTRFAGNDSGLPSSPTDKIKTSPNVTIPKVDSEVDLSDGNVEILTNGLYQQTLEGGNVVRFRYADELTIVQTDETTTNTIKSTADKANVILSGVNINITDGVTTPVEVSGAIKITIDGDNRIGTSADNAIKAGTIEFEYAGSTEDVLSMDASEQAIASTNIMPATVTGFTGKTSAEFENTDGDKIVDDSEFVAFNRPQVVYVGGVKIVENGAVIESELAEFDGTVSYDAKNATLTLDGAKITEMYDDTAIYADGDLRINVKTESTIDLSDNSYDSVGMYIEGEVTVIGEELNIIKKGSSYSDFYGIYAYYGANIKNTTNIESDSNYAYGVYSGYGDVNVTGGTLSVSAPNSDYYGIYSEYGNVNATDANMDIYMPYGKGVYVYNDNSSISFVDSTVTIEAQYGLYCYDYNYNQVVKMEGSDVKLYTSEVGIYCEYGTVSLTDTKLDIIPKNEDSSKTYYGIEADKMTVDGGDVNIEAYYTGVNVQSDFSMVDGDVDIVAGSYGICNYGKFTVSGGDINLEATGYYGIYLDYYPMTVTGGTVLAKGGSAGIYSYSSTIDLSKYEGAVGLVGNSEDSLTVADINSSYWFSGEKVVNIAKKYVGSIFVDGVESTGFSEDIRFNTFVNEDVSVEIEAEDVGEGIDEILYYLSDKPLSESEVESLDDAKWNSGTNFVISDDGKYVIYAKIIDKDGNATYISSHGIVIDKQAPVINGIKNETIYCQGQEFTVSDDNLNHIMINGITVDIQDAYELLSSNGQAGVDYEIVVVDKAGNETVVCVVINSDHTYGEYEVVVEPTCEDDGYDEAKCNYCDSTKRNVTKNVGHKWGTPAFVWDADFSKVVLRVVCENDETHIHDVEGVLTSKKTDATCFGEGKIVYTVTAEYEEKQYKETKEVVIPAMDHDWSGEWTVTKEATATEEGTKETNCKNGCGQKRVDVVPKTGEADDNSTFEHYVEVEPEAPITDATLNNAKDELIEADGIFDDLEKEAIADGEDAKVWIEIGKTMETTLTEEEKALIEDAAATIMGEDVNICYFEVDLFKQVGDGDKEKIKEPGVAIKISIIIPEELRNNDGSKIREYKIIRLHEGKVDVIDGEFDAKTGVFTFETDKFSTYAITYEDVPVNNDNKPVSPDTGYNSISYVFAIMMICGLGIILCASKRKVANKGI